VDEAATISFEDFLRVDVRVGRILEAEEFPRARRPAYRLRIDFGPLGERRSSAQLTENYEREELVGRLVLAVVNFPPKQIANFFSEALVLGVPDERGHVVLLAPERDVPLGGRMY
jgi:tRNA-binding protein